MNIEKNMMMILTSTVLAAALIALCACDPGDNVSDDDFRGEYDDIVIDCDMDGQCWALDNDWDAWAAVITNAQIDDGVASGLLTSTRNIVAGDQCWILAGTDGHLCTANLGTTRLVGRPASELSLSTPGNGCASLGGIWTSHGQGLGMCFGILDGVAIQLDVDPF